jgi:hypothetical protein
MSGVWEDKLAHTTSGSTVEAKQIQRMMIAFENRPTRCAGTPNTLAEQRHGSKYFPAVVPAASNLSRQRPSAGHISRPALLCTAPTDRNTAHFETNPTSCAVLKKSLRPIERFAFAEVGPQLLGCWLKRSLRNSPAGTFLSQHPQSLYVENTALAATEVIQHHTAHQPITARRSRSGKEDGRMGAGPNLRSELKVC